MTTSTDGTDGTPDGVSHDTGERLRRWRLLLGEAAEASTGSLGRRDTGVDRALAALYEQRRGVQVVDGLGINRSAGLGGSAPRVSRWLGDIRRYFPSTVVQVMQRDALERLGLRQMLLEPELLAAVEPDVHLVGTLLALKDVIPERTMDTARQVVRKVTDQLEERLAEQTRQALSGALDRTRRGRPRSAREIDWNRTIRANLKNYQRKTGQVEYNTVIPERIIGHARRQRAFEREIVLCVDQSGSMASSVVYSSVFAAALAGLRSLHTRMVVFDTSVVDLTEHLHDPVELLFGTQLGGGTDIEQALAACQGLVTRPAETVLVLISDLYEGGDSDRLLRRAEELTRSGVTMVALLALSDGGAPAYDHSVAAALANQSIPAFACTPDKFPALLAAAVKGEDLGRWAGEQGIPAHGTGGGAG